MKHLQTILTVYLLLSGVESWKSPNPKFVSDITDFFSRNGLTYYIPDGDKSGIHQYFKEFQK